MKRITFTETMDSEGRQVIKAGRRILARWRNDMPGQCGRYQWVRERRAVEAGYGELAYLAIQCALYENGLSDFSPARHTPERCIDYVCK